MCFDQIARWSKSQLMSDDLFWYRTGRIRSSFPELVDYMVGPVYIRCVFQAMFWQSSEIKPSTHKRLEDGNSPKPRTFLLFGAWNGPWFGELLWVTPAWSSAATRTLPLLKLAVSKLQLHAMRQSFGSATGRVSHGDSSHWTVHFCFGGWKPHSKSIGRHIHRVHVKVYLDEYVNMSSKATKVQNTPMGLSRNLEPRYIPWVRTVSIGFCCRFGVFLKSPTLPRVILKSTATSRS